MSKILERKELPEEQKWNSRAVFESWDEWRAEAEAITADIPQLTEFKGKLAQGPATLADWLEIVTAFEPRLNRLMVYVFFSVTVDANDATAKACQGQVIGIIAKYSAATAFAEPEMLAIGDTLLDWAKEESRLTIYTHYFDNLLRQKKHLRSAEVEEILGMVQDPFSGPYRTFRELTNLDMTFPDALDSQGESHLVAQATVTPTGIDSPDRARRRNAWQNYYDGYLSLKNTLASNYITNVKQFVFMARVRGYSSVLEAKLAPNNMPVEVFHNFINTFKENLSVWHKYWTVKRQVLGVDQLHPYDIWAPIVEREPVISYGEGVDMICEGMAPLGAAYVDAMRQGCLEEGWVDYAQNSGKSQGAASFPGVDTPPFLFMSYNDTLSAVSILAHELGHSMHSYLSNATQPYVYKLHYNQSMFSSSAAETASNFNQALTRAYLLEKRADDPVFQMALINEAINNFHRYFFIMPTLARFEYEVFTLAEADKPLTADILNNLMADLFAEGYGDTMSDDRERTSITWAQFGHLYSPFYTFQYGIGISAAHALAERVLAGSQAAVDNYLNFLNAGVSLYVTDMFKLAGVDMTEPAPVEKAFAMLRDLVDRLEGLVDA
jgi:oligoendopeptidase F